MCPPVIAAVAAFAASPAGTATLAGLTLASTGVGVAGALQSSKAAQASANYQGQLADINALNADRAARDALERGTLDAVKHGREVAKLRGQQTQAFASQGLDLGFGTPLDTAGDTAMLAAEDNRTIAENAAREADSFRINAQNYRADAAGARAAGANARTAGLINAGTTLLNGATQIGGQFAKYGGAQKSYAPRIFG